MKVLAALALLAATADFAAGQLVGINYNSATGHNQFLCINRTTGNVTVLHVFDFDSGLWFPASFATDLAAGRAYAVSSIGTLYTFDLTSGAVLQHVPLGSAPVISAVALGMGGKILGVRNSSTAGQIDLCSITPATGAVTILNTVNLNGGGWIGETFVSDRSLFGPGGNQGTSYLMTTNNSGGMPTLRKFNATTGASLGTIALPPSPQPIGIAVGPAGTVIVLQQGSGVRKVVKFDPVTGSTALLSSFPAAGGVNSFSFTSDLTAQIGSVNAGNNNDRVYSFNILFGGPATSAVLVGSLQAMDSGSGRPCPMPRDASRRHTRRSSGQRTR